MNGDTSKGIPYPFKGGGGWLEGVFIKMSL